MNWNELSIQEKADLIKLYVANGITSLDTIKEHYNSFQDGSLMKLKDTEPNFVTRLKQGNSRKSIIDNEGNPASHKLSVADSRVYAGVQEDEKGNLRDYGAIPYRKFYAYDRALENSDYIEFPNDESAVNFTEHYKDAAVYPWYGTFDNYYPWRYQDGGDIKKPRGYRVSSAIMNLAHRAVDKNAANTIDTPDNGAPQSTFLMNRKNQQKVFEDEGYTKVNDGNYGPVAGAVNSSKHKDVPIYQKYPDADVDRNNLQKVGTFMDYSIINANTKTNVYNGPVESYLTDPANFPVDVYIDRKTGKVYNQGWDYNDYNNIRSTTGISKLKNVAGNILDRIGNPTVVTTGLQENTIKSTEADRYLHSKNPMLSYQKNEDTGEYEIMMKPVTVTAKRTNPVKPKVELRPASELNADEFWDMMEANSRQNGGSIGRRSNYTPPSLFATSNISAADNTRTNINQEISNIVAAREAQKQAAEQAYLDRRGYISEDKDKRSYAQRDINAKIAATQNAKTDFYQMASPNAQSTDVTPGQVLLPAVVAGSTFAAPLTSLAYGAMYEPMEKAGVYQPVSLGLQKLGVNENTANTISPFITDPAISLAGPIVRKFGSAYNKAWDSTYGSLNNLGIYNGFPIRTPNKKDASSVINKLLYNNSLQKETVKGTPLYLSHTTKDTGLESLIKDKNGILSAPSISVTKGDPEYPMFSYIRNISRNNSIQPYMSPTDFSFFFKPSYIDKFKHVGVLSDMYSPTIGDVKRYMGLPYNAKVSNSDVLKVKRQMLEDYGTWTDLNAYLRLGIEPKDVIPKLNMRGLKSMSLGDIAKNRDLLSTYAEVMPFGLVDLKKAMFVINNPYSNGIKANPVLREWIKDNNIPLFDYIEQVPSSLIDKIKFKNGGNLSQQGNSLGKVTPYGQWQYPHQITTIPSNNITMKGVDYPVIGVSNTGDTKIMFPNLDYTFNGNYVTEYPIN